MSKRKRERERRDEARTERGKEKEEGRERAEKDSGRNDEAQVYEYYFPADVLDDRTSSGVVVVVVINDVARVRRGEAAPSLRQVEERWTKRDRGGSGGGRKDGDGERVRGCRR